MATRLRYRPRQAPRCIARAALLAVLLQLVVAFVGLGQLAAKGFGDAPFVICTGAGLVWVNPDGTPVKDQKETDQICPICAPSKLVATVDLPIMAALMLPAPQSIRPAPAERDEPLALQTAPPLPARGPPPAA